MFHVVLNEEVLEPPYPTEAAAYEAAQAMVQALAERGEHATYVIWPAPKPN